MPSFAPADSVRRGLIACLGVWLLRAQRPEAYER